MHGWDELTHHHHVMPHQYGHQWWSEASHSSIASSLLLYLLIITRKNVPTSLGSLTHLHVFFRRGMKRCVGDINHKYTGVRSSSWISAKSEWLEEQETPRCSFHRGRLCCSSALKWGFTPNPTPVYLKPGPRWDKYRRKGSTGNQYLSWDSLQEVSMGKCKGHICKFSYSRVLSFHSLQSQAWLCQYW